MAKINHNNIIDTINDIVGHAKEKGIIHLEHKDNYWSGNELILGNKRKINLGTSGYLGLETHPKLIEGAIDYTKRYGTQFSISRAYVTSQINEELEDLLSKIFDEHPTIVFSSTSLAHIAIIPIIINSNDAIILDQQAHQSMQTACQIVAAKGTHIDIIRHNNIEMLERTIQSYDNKYNKIWYVFDGVYSMFGDLPPIEELKQLSSKYPKLHFYVDDAHGMSWTGNNGSGSLFHAMQNNKKTMLLTTMAKGFGSIGGTAVFPNKKMYDRVRIFGGALAHSHPLAPGIIGASTASAKLHLSDEIIELQNKLKERINYCNTLLEQSDIPILSNLKTPIYFIGTGQPNVGYNLNKRLLEEGFYINIGMFPAVPVKNTGLRFSINNHISKDDISHFIDALKYHYPKALAEEGKTNNHVRKAFKLPLLEENNDQKQNSNYTIKVYRTIKEIPQLIWDNKMGHNPMNNYQQLLLNEEAFCNNKLKEQNSEMYYFIISEDNTIVCITYFSLTVLKDDMFLDSKISREAEKKRQKDIYYLTSNYLLMGSLLSEGNHIYIEPNVDANTILDLLLDRIYKLQEEKQFNTILFRDFPDSESRISKLLYDKGFAKINMPNTNIIPELPKTNDHSIVELLSKNSKKNFKRYIEKQESLFKVQFKSNLTSEELELFIKLQFDLSSKNMSINLYKYPKKLFHLMNQAKEWEFILLFDNTTNETIGIGSILKHEDSYVPVLLGIKQIEKRKAYHQMLYQVVKRALDLNCKTVYLGLTADEAKKDVGAQQFSRKAFIQSKDNFTFEVLETLNVNRYEYD